MRAAADVLDNTRKRFAKIYDIRDALTDNDKVNLSKLPDSEVRGGKGTGNIGLLSRLNLTHGRQLKATPKMTGNAIRNLLINISTNPEFQQETLLNILGRFYPDRFTGLTRGVCIVEIKKEVKINNVTINVSLSDSE